MTAAAWCSAETWRTVTSLQVFFKALAAKTWFRFNQKKIQMLGKSSIICIYYILYIYVYTRIFWVLRNLALQMTPVCPCWWHLEISDVRPSQAPSISEGPIGVAPNKFWKSDPTSLYLMVEKVNNLRNGFTLSLCNLRLSIHLVNLSWWSRWRPLTGCWPDCVVPFSEWAHPVPFFLP